MVSPESLRKYRCFTGGGEEALNLLADMAAEVHLPAGEALFYDGDDADLLYVVVSGQVELALQLGDGQLQPVDTMVAGDLVGWSAVADARKRCAQATAKVPAHLIAIDGKRLTKLCDENTQFGLRLMREVTHALARRLDSTRIQLAAANA